MSREFYVYGLHRPGDMSICYIGKGQKNRCFDHYKASEKHCNPHLRNIIVSSDDPLPITIFFAGLQEQAAFDLEVKLIAFYGRSDKGLGKLCNMTDGGDQAPGYFGKHRPESIEKMRKSAQANASKQSERMKGNKLTLGRKLSEEHKAKIHPKGRKHSPETIAKMRAARIVRWSDPDYREVQSARLRSISGIGIDAAIAKLARSS